jgi:hypothetical protein
MEFFSKLGPSDLSHGLGRFCGGLSDLFHGLERFCGGPTFCSFSCLVQLRVQVWCRKKRGKFGVTA